MRSPQVYLSSLLLATMAFGAGCAPVLIATAGAVAGYAVSRDSVIIDLDQPLDRVWSACLEETKRQGRVKKEDLAGGRIEAAIRQVDVTISVESLTPQTVRVVIRARKYLLPQVDVAQRLGVGIARRVK